MAEKTKKTLMTPMTIERITALITAMEDNEWTLVKIDMRNGVSGIQTERRAERWMTLHDIRSILTNPEYAEELAQIFLSDEIDTEEGGGFDA